MFTEDTGETGVKHGALLLCFGEELFGDGYLWCAAVKTEDK
jgi:hypothetical protein